jgi:hypothetical protein
MENINSDVDSVLSRKSDPLKEYQDTTTYDTHLVDIEQNFYSGSIKITPEIAAQAKIAIENRIKSVKLDTKKRIDKINDNFKFYYSSESSGSQKSNNPVFVPETFNAVQDSVDDFYLMFHNLIDYLEIESNGYTLDEYLTLILPVSEGEEVLKRGFFRSILNFVVKKNNLKEEDTYYIRKKELVLEFLKNSLRQSKYKDKLLKFLIDGVVQGMFVIKDSWGPTGDFKLVNKKGKYSYELNQEDVYQFTPVDPRLIIFPKHGMEWVCEKIPTTFHELLDIVLDSNGKPIKTPKYDVKRLKELAKYLKDAGASSIKTPEPNSDWDNQYEEDGEETKQLYNIDGNLTLYESHLIPLKIGKDSVPYKYLVYSVNLNESNSYDESAEEDPNLFIIGAMKTPYIAGHPYLYESFVEDEKSIGGIGLPELIKPLQKIINEFSGLSLDNTYFGLYGLLILDESSFVSPVNFTQLSPKTVLKTKNLKGRSVKDIFQWLHPNTAIFNQMERLYNLYLDALKRTSRKGPTGEKVTPNPSATEFSSMIKELQKSINQVGIRLNNMFVKMLERIYSYNIINAREKVSLKVQSYKITDKNNIAKILRENDFGVDEVNESGYLMTQKSVDLTVEDLFVDNLNFRLKAAETFDKKAIEKQQTMQIYNVLVKNGAITNPDGTPKVMVDDVGAQVKISEYKITKQLLDSFDIEDVFEKVNAEKLNQQPIAPTQSNETGVPPLTARPNTASTLNQATAFGTGEII